MFYIYIIQSGKNRMYYVGCTSNVENRFAQHNSGKVKSTKNKRPWSLIHTEKYNTLSEARKRETQIKSWKSRLAIERIINTALSSNG